MIYQKKICGIIDSAPSFCHSVRGDNSKTVHYRYTKLHTWLPLPGELWTDPIFSEKNPKWPTYSEFYPKICLFGEITQKPHNIVTPNGVYSFFLYNNEVWTNPFYWEKNSKWPTFINFYSKTIRYRYTKSHTHIPLHNECEPTRFFSE